MALLVIKNKVLLKLQASSLIENLVASVLIILVFMIASFSLNNIFGNYIQSDEQELQQRFSELSYLFINDKINIGYSENYNTDIISIEKATGKPFVFYRRNGKILKSKEINYNDY